MSKKEPIEDITLEVGVAYQDPISNLRIIRLPARVMFQLDVLIEDVVQIEGGPLLTKMDVLVWAAYPEDEERLIARVSQDVLDTLEVKEGDLIKIRLSTFQKEAKHRKEETIHHNKQIPVLTMDDLIVAEVAENDKLLMENPDGSFKKGEIFCVPDRDGALIIVGEGVDFSQEISNTVQSRDHTPSSLIDGSSEDHYKKEETTKHPPIEEEGEYEEQIEIVNHRVEISELTRMCITRKKKGKPDVKDAQNMVKETSSPNTIN